MLPVDVTIEHVFEVFDFNIESYGKTTVLGDRDVRRRVCGKSEMSIEPIDPRHSPSIVWVSARIHCGPVLSFPRKQKIPNVQSMELIVFS